MKKILFILIAVIVVTGTVGAQSRKKSSGSHKKKNTASVLPVAKGEVRDYGDVLTTQVFTVKKGKENEVKVEYPVAGNPTLVNSIRNKIKDSVNEDFTGSLDSPEALLRSALKDKRDMKFGEEGESLSQNIMIIYSNPDIITYSEQKYTYMGGAHGMPLATGQTFLISDGSTLNIDMLPPFSKLRPYIMKGLAESYGVGEKDLDSILFDPSGLSEYPTTVYATDRGLEFVYQPYEIAPYSAGTPRVVVPFTTDVVNLLSDSAKRFVVK